MRILFLTTRLPFPPLGGERLRPFYFLKYFPSDWKITLCAFKEKESEGPTSDTHSFPNVRIRTVTLPKYQSYLACLKGFLSSYPLEVAYYASKKMQRLIQEEMRLEKYDLIFCHLLRMAPYAVGIPGVKKVLDLSDALSLRYALSWRLRPGYFRMIEWLESRRLEVYEPHIAACFDLNLVASFSDQAYFTEKLGIERLAVVENGIELPGQGPCAPRTNQKKIVFFANLRAFPNQDAARYFYGRIFPLIKKRIAGAKFVIVGAGIPRDILRLISDASVEICRDVADIRPFVEDACVSVAPMRIAVGIQNKIIQSMAYKVPVVTTHLGLGGIRAKAGKEILVADTPDDFAHQVIRVMEDGDLRNSIAAHAYSLVQTKYLWRDTIAALARRLVSFSQG